MKLSEKLLYCSGQLGVMLSARFFFQWIIKYSNTGVFVSSSLASLILFFRFYDAISDPICGYFSDRIKNKFSLINLSIPFFCLGLVLCFYPSAQTSAKWFFEFFGMIFFFTGYTLYCIPYWSLISNYKNDQSSLSNSLGFALLIATALGFILSPAMIENYGYLNSAIITATSSFFLMYLPNFCSKNSSKETENNITKNKSTIFSQIFSEIINALKDKKFIQASSIFVPAQMSLTIMTTAAPFIAVDLLGGKTSDVSKLLTPMIIVAIPSFYLSQKLSKFWDWNKAIHRAAILLALLYCCTMLVSSSILNYSIIFAFSGLPIAILLGQEAQAVSEIGAEKISTYFGALNFLIKSGNGIALFLTGILAELSLSNTSLIMYIPFVAGLILLVGLFQYSRIRKA